MYSDEINIDTQNLSFEPVSANIAKASVDTDEAKIAIIRICHDGIYTDIAVHADYFAGITEDEEDISIHLCCMEEIEDVGRTIRLHKTDGLITVGEYYSFTHLDAYIYFLMGGDLAYPDVIKWYNEI